jgi:hypothetical protein
MEFALLLALATAAERRMDAFACEFRKTHWVKDDRGWQYLNSVFSTRK